jgi:3-deoxy-D-manno-octulosonate 8-phosphate phosphatase (KDO 8-P phosphatase)
MNNADAPLATCYGPVSQTFLDRAAKIRLLILDVDGVLSPTGLSIWVITARS